MNVAIRCICPTTGKVRHPGGDTVVLRERLPFRGAHAIRWAVSMLRHQDPDVSGADVLAVLSEEYVINGVESWTLHDDKGPIEVSSTNIRKLLLSEYDVAFVVADAADDLYSEVMLPLLNGAETSSPPSPTDESTSQTTPSSEKPPKPSKRSSITTLPTGGIETTSNSLDGDSSLSPNSASAA